MISIISDIKAFAVLFFNSFWIDEEIMEIPFTCVLMLSANNCRKRDSNFDGIIVVVTGEGPEASETTIAPSLSDPSDIDTKYPFSNFCTRREKLRPSKLTVFLEKPFGELNAI